MINNTFYNVLNNPIAKVALATSLLVSTGISVATPILSGVSQQAEAAVKSETVTFGESLNSNRSKTITLPNNAKIKNITTNTGKVNYSLSGNQLTINVSDGSSTKQVENPTKHSKQVNNSLTSTSNSFSETNNYSDAEGFSGTLIKNAAAVVISGNYTASESKSVTDSITSTSNSFSESKPYNSNGYSGSLSKSGLVTSSQVASGGYNQPTGYYQESGYYEQTGYYSDSGYWEQGNYWYHYDGTRTWDPSLTRWVSTGQEWVDTGSKWVSTGQQWVSTGNQWITTYTTHYTQNYLGTVSKPASDTRTWSQGYSGTAYKAGNDSLYDYNVLVEFTTDETPPNINLSLPHTNQTNKDLEIKADISDNESSLAVQKWAFGEQDKSYFSTEGQSILNGTFLATQNGIYTVYASDSEGNDIVKTIEISTIDKTPPSPAKFSVDNAEITNKDVQIGIEYPSDANIKEYRINQEDWKIYSDTLNLSANGTIEARSTDGVGNVSEAVSVKVNNIDKVSPSIDSVSLINDFVTISTSDNHSGVASVSVKVENGSFESYKENSLKIIQNTKVTVRTIDKAKNTIEQVFDLVTDAYYQKMLAPILLITEQLKTEEQNKATLIEMKDNLEKILTNSNDLIVDSERNDIAQKANDLIKQIQVILDSLEKAKVELEDLGENPTQLELDKAKDIIDGLPPGPEKEELLKDLEEKQNQKDLGDAKKIVDNLSDNPSQAEIDHARDVVKDLIDSEGKKDLLDIIENKQNNLDKLIEEATKAVDALTDRSTQDEFQNAKDLVNKLPNGPEKDALLDKLKEKEKATKDRLALDALLEKAEAAVKHAETFPANFNIEQAEKAVNILPDIPEKNPLLERIETIKDNVLLDEAKKKVEQAERYERDPYLTDAIALVDALKESNGKQALKERLQAILDKLKASKDLEDVAKGNDGTFDSTNPDRSIEDAINTIQDLDAKNYLTRWHKANEHASNYFSRAMTANATKFKVELPANYLAKASYANLIVELTTRTENLSTAWQEASKNKLSEQLFSKAYTLVSLYETSKNDRNYKNAVAAISELPDGIAKKALETQLTSLKNHLEEEDSAPTLNSKEAIQQAEKAVANYEKYQTSYYQKKANEVVELLVDSEEKTAFQGRLAKITK